MSPALGSDDSLGRTIAALALFCPRPRIGSVHDGTMYPRLEEMGGIDRGGGHPFRHSASHSKESVRPLGLRYSKRLRDRELEYQPDHLVYSLVYSADLN